MDDDSIYNAIIIALIIGIIIVIITLIVARPEPERFTELYFENHKELPRFVEERESYNFTFAVANHEGNDLLYHYNITKELYNFDYSCESSSLYFEEKESSIYEMFLSRNYSMATRISETREPSLIIKEDSYSASFSYLIRGGAGQLVVKFKDEEGKERYAVVFSGRKALLLDFLSDRIKIKRKELVSQKEIHSVRIEVKGSRIIVHFDGKMAFDTQLENHGTGFFAFETTQTFAEISNFIIRKANMEQRVDVRFEDVSYETIELETRRAIGEDKYFTYINYPKEKYRDAYLYYYTSGKDIDFQEYSLEAVFKLTSGEKMSIGKEGNFEVLYNEKDDRLLFLWESNEGFKMSLKDISSLEEWHKIRIDVKNNEARVYFDLDQVKNMELRTRTGLPYVKTYDSSILLREFSARDLNNPEIIRYTVPTKNQQNITYAEAADTSLLQLARNIMFNSSSIQQREIFEDLFEKQKTKSEHYRITANYVDMGRNSTVVLSFNQLEKTLYSLSIDDKDNEVGIIYESNNKQEEINKKNLLSGNLYHKVTIDADEDKLQINLDNVEIFNENIDKINDGVLLVDSPDEVRFAKLQIEDMDTGEIKVLRTERDRCEPIFIKDESSRSEAIVQKDHKEEIQSTVKFVDDFDIAKVSVSLDTGQEIHFWVSRI